MSSQVVWRTPPSVLAARVADYPQIVTSRIGRMLLDEKIDSTRWMKQNRPWNDITGNARRGLRVEVVKQGAGFDMFFIHSVEYGVGLELDRGGRNAVIIPAIRRAVPRIKSKLKGIGN